MKTLIKLLALTGSLTLAALPAFSQTNIFPSAGNVGIGTLTPNKPLVVAGDAVKIDFSGSNEGRLIFHSSNGGRSLSFGVNGKTGGWRWHLIDASDTEYFTVDHPTGDATIFGSLFVPGGNVGIGTLSPTHPLTVNGAIRAKEVIVNTGWADDVFAAGYKLRSLAETENYIQNNGRLPGIPSAKEVEANGVGVGEAQSMLLRKIEELTLHMIQMEKRLAELEAENATLKAK